MTMKLQEVMSDSNITNSYMVQQNEELQRAEKELELTRKAMEEKEREHQRQITE